MSIATRDHTELSCRVATLEPSTIDESSRSVEAVIATETPAFSMNMRTREASLEVLLMDGVQHIDGQIPLLDVHRRDSVRDQIGSIRDMRVRGGKLIGRLYVSESEPKTWAKIREGHIKDVSVGRQLLADSTVIYAGTTATVAGRSYQAPPGHNLEIVTRWRPREGSLTPIGSDEGAKIRSDVGNFSGETQMATATQSVGRGADISIRQHNQQILERAGLSVPRNDPEAMRDALEYLEIKGRSAMDLGTAGYGSRYADQALIGSRAGVNTLADWTLVDTMKNFLKHRTAVVDNPSQMRRVPRGGTAQQSGFGVGAATEYRAHRYADAREFDEQDILDFETIGGWDQAGREAGAAAGRLPKDLAFSYLLTNGQLGDGVAIFATARGNLGMAPLTSTSLAAAWEAIAGRTLSTLDSEVVHAGLTPKYLVVAPQLVVSAEAAVASMWPDNTSPGRLVVRSESRLGPDGVFDPISEATVTPNAAGRPWLLACETGESPGLVIGSLTGTLDPKIDITPLSNGRWGIHASVRLDLAVVVANPNALYMSSGTGA